MGIATRGLAPFVGVGEADPCRADDGAWFNSRALHQTKLARADGSPGVASLHDRRRIDTSRNFTFNRSTRSLIIEATG